jgi:hypothetical protein
MKVKMFSFLNLTMHFLLLQSSPHPSRPQTLFKSPEDQSKDVRSVHPEKKRK